MKKYREEIMGVINDNRTDFEADMKERMNGITEWGEDMKKLMIDEFRLRVLFPRLSKSAIVQWYSNHCTIDENLEIHGDDDDWIPDLSMTLPIVDMPCADEDIADAGLYFLGMVGTNPITNKSYYLVKIGKARNVSERVRQYASYNPMVFTTHCIFPVEDGREEATRYERIAHNALAKVAYARAQKAKEWFYVDEETYMALCEQCSTLEGWKELLGEK